MVSAGRFSKGARVLSYQHANDGDEGDDLGHAPEGEEQSAQHFELGGCVKAMCECEFKSLYNGPPGSRRYLASVSLLYIQSRCDASLDCSSRVRRMRLVPARGGDLHQSWGGVHVDGRKTEAP
jgi:hypothetical protein